MSTDHIDHSSSTMMRLVMAGRDGHTSIGSLPHGSRMMSKNALTGHTRDAICPQVTTRCHPHGCRKHLNEQVELWIPKHEISASHREIRSIAHRCGPVIDVIPRDYPSAT